MRYLLFFLFSIGLSIFNIQAQTENGWAVHPNGSFSFTYNGLELKNAYPAFNGVAIHPTSVEVNNTKSTKHIKYTLQQGTVEVTLSKNKNAYIISSKLENLKAIPGHFQPLGSAIIKGADRFYKQGFGFAGPSGIFPIPDVQKRMEQLSLKHDVWSYDGYLFFGLIAPNENTMVISAYDHKNYLHRTTLFNKQNRVGLIDRHMGDNTIFLESGFATEEVKPDGDVLTLPDIYITCGNEAYATFHKQARQMAEFNTIKLQHSPRYHYCSWYEFQKEFTDEILTNMLQGIEKSDIKPEFQTIQIDDGYSYYGDWLNINERFPDGMEATVKKIKDAGYNAGIWVGVFMVSSRSFIFKEHKDWLIRDLNGELIINMDNGDEKVYILDSSHPEAMQYIRKVFRTFRQMGITSYKTDFMDWGYLDSRKVKRHTPGKTSAQYFNDVLEAIRQEIGDESYWLACISPYQPFVGYADGMRLSNDVHHTWNDYNTVNMFTEMYAGQFFNNVLWQNDPDVLYLRNYKTDLSDAEKYSIALYDGIMGGVVNTSCRFHTITEEYKKLWKFIKPASEHYTAKLPFWSNPDSTLECVREYENTKNKAVLFVNYSDKPVSETYSLQNICGLSKAKIYTWLPHKVTETDMEQEIKISLQPHESVLYYISSDGKAPDKNATLNSIGK